MQTENVDYSKYLAPKRSCVICGSDNFDVWCKEDIFDTLECKSCGLVFVNPCLNEQGLDIVYSGHHNGRMDDEEACRKREPMYELDRDFLLSVIDSGKVLDVGCGAGFFLNKFDSAKWEKYGVEIDKDTVEYAKDHFKDIDLRLWDSATIPHEDNSFDVIMFRGSYEHMLNPEVVAKEVARVLRPGGYAYFCATPNADSFCAQTYRNRWNQFDAKEHIFIFSYKTMEKMFHPLGFKTVKTASFYEETPYCDLENDILQIAEDIKLKREGKQDQMSVSPAFYGNMMNIVFQKEAH